MYLVVQPLAMFISMYIHAKTGSEIILGDESRHLTHFKGKSCFVVIWSPMTGTLRFVNLANSPMLLVLA